MSKSGWKQRLAAGGGGHSREWWHLRLAPAQPAGLPDSFAIGNGRIEATEIDIATKTAGRITESLVNDGDVVEAGQVLARMDTQTLEASCVSTPRSGSRRPRHVPPSWPNARARRPATPSWPNARVQRPLPPPL